MNEVKNPPIARKSLTLDDLDKMILVTFDLYAASVKHGKNNKYVFSQMIRKWCVFNTTSTWHYQQVYKYNGSKMIEYAQLYFASHTDAVSFKLTWL